MGSSGSIVRGEWVVFGLLLAWLVWLPLPFGSVVEGARLTLVAVPLGLCSAAAALRLLAARDRTPPGRPTRPWVLWRTGAAVLIAVGALQLVPLPAAVVQMLSPEAHEIWRRAGELASNAGIAAPPYRLSVDPTATAAEIFRLLGLVGSFTTAVLLIRTHDRRTALAVVLSATAVFEAIYGMREAALQRYEIWGWVNRLIFDRVTGTFVNPNHFAHYLAIVLPLPLFLVAVQWHRAGPPGTPFGPKLVALFERAALRTGLALLAAVACAAGLLLAQSRGALLALAVGLLTAAAMLPGRQASRIVAAGLAGLVLLVALVVFLGPERTVRRFVPSAGEVETLVGRRIGISTATAVWKRFPLFGSGLGTFGRVVSMEQREALDKIYHHAHNDYLEIGATAGIAGGGPALLALLAGAVALARMAAGAAPAGAGVSNAEELTWRRRVFQIAALASLTAAMVHALFDFNFFIPSNPATLSVILGAAVASIRHDVRIPLEGVRGAADSSQARRRTRDQDRRSRR